MIYLRVTLQVLDEDVKSVSYYLLRRGNGMKPSHEMIPMPYAAFPVRFFLRSNQKEADIYVHPHWHDLVEILFVQKGNIHQQINNDIFDAGIGSLIVISSDQVHSTYTHKEDKNVILVLQFDPDFLQPKDFLAPEHKLIDLFKNRIEFPNLIPVDKEPIKEVVAGYCI